MLGLATAATVQFTAAQAAQKISCIAKPLSTAFTAAQAAQKIARDDFKRAIRFTAAQAAQKYLGSLGGLHTSIHCRTGSSE